MAEERVQRRLAAILAADVAGYSRLMGADEEGTLSALTAHRTELIEPCVAEHRGRVVKTTGDGLLVEFPSVVDAVRCAVAFQDGMRARNADTPEDRRIVFRIGVNLGDVIIQDGDIYGDGVNVAARLEGLAEPGSVCVSGSVHEQVVNKIEVRFDDLGPRRVKNIGEPVRAFRIRSDESAAAGPDPAGAPPLPDKPSIAVLPFENMSADPEQEYFSDGITEDIITELSKISGLFVIARHSAFTYKGQSITLKQVGRELGVRCVLEGSVRKAGNRLRITAQLIDAMTDHHLWAERYDRDIEDIFAVQDEVARCVADALAVTLKPGESEQLAHAPTESISAYDHYLRARTRPWPPTESNIASARAAYASMIDHEPDFVGGYAGKSISHSMAVLFGHSKDIDFDATAAMDLGRQAIELDPEFARSHSALGLAHSASGQHAEAVAAARRAVELQPGDADSHAWLARCQMWAGESEEACDAAEMALRLDPQYVEGPYLNLLGRVLYISGRDQEALDAYQRNDDRGGPQGPTRHLIWAAAYGQLGLIEKARPHVTELMRLLPNKSVEEIAKFHGMPSDREARRLAEGLRKAGLPE